MTRKAVIDNPTTRELAIQITSLDERLTAELEHLSEMAKTMAVQYATDKAQANEWRGALRDAVAENKGKGSGYASSWLIFVTILGFALTLFAILKKG